MYEAKLITRQESFMSLENDWEALVRHIEHAEIFGIGIGFMSNIFSKKTGCLSLLYMMAASVSRLRLCESIVRDSRNFP